MGGKESGREKSEEKYGFSPVKKTDVSEANKGFDCAEMMGFEYLQPKLPF
jgi:hypothetical protein